ncbi:ORF45 [Leucania separata nucleopolyhedrovirus]|uniref:ORF45 n=1 Tax=Leucania separata nucleopolyhedrovirus TaxID=1307956 RepID=Q0IL74_NPVLS|nr:ORF45 [Leucania separata nucleopolyhedrovirus]AAR28809.1 ORF45 [Leucania separata nucleopolyhedrovirus]
MEQQQQQQPIKFDFNHLELVDDPQILIDQIEELLRDIDDVMSDKFPLDVYDDDDYNDDHWPRLCITNDYELALDCYRRLNELNVPLRFADDFVLKDTTKLFMDVLHIVYPDMERGILEACKFRGERQSNLDDPIVKSKEVDDGVYKSFRRYVMK